MTAQRHERNGRYHKTVLFASIAGFVIAFLVCADLLVSRSAASERVVINRFSGLAIEGFDPVAYFVDGQPKRGLPDFEAALSGAVWRFRNEGNKASFLAHPDIYGPQFGGYDPTDLARGVTLAGNPLFWVISAQRLYLFGIEANRDAFTADPERFLPQANKRWPELARDLPD